MASFTHFRTFTLLIDSQGLTFYSGIERELNKGTITFVPEVMKATGEIGWKCVLLHKSKANYSIDSGLKLAVSIVISLCF